MNRHGPRDPSEGSAEADSPPQAPLERPSHPLDVAPGMESPGLALFAVELVKVPFECHPAKGGTVQKTGTLFTVLKPSRGRRK